MPEPLVKWIKTANVLAAFSVRECSGGTFATSTTAATICTSSLHRFFLYFSMTPDATGLLQPCSGLQSWWEEISTREAMIKTQPKLG